MLALLVWSELEQAVKKQHVVGAPDPWVEPLEEGSWISSSVCLVRYS